MLRDELLEYQAMCEILATATQRFGRHAAIRRVGPDWPGAYHRDGDVRRQIGWIYEGRFAVLGEGVTWSEALGDALAAQTRGFA